MPLACMICVATRGLRGSEIASPPKTEEEQMEHMESVHHCPVVREGETKAQAEARFLAAYPEARTCPDCVGRGAPWASA